MDEVSLPTLDPMQSLVFSDPVVYENSPWVQVFRVTLKAEGLAASAVVSELYDNTGFPALVRYFERLAADYRGWDGNREWAGSEGNLRLSASHDRLSRITLVVALDKYAGGDPEDDWRVVTPMLLEPGTALDRAAASLKRFLRQ